MLKELLDNFPYFLCLKCYWLDIRHPVLITEPYFLSFIFFFFLLFHVVYTFMEVLVLSLKYSYYTLLFYDRYKIGIRYASKRVTTLYWHTITIQNHSGKKSKLIKYIDLTVFIKAYNKDTWEWVQSTSNVKIYMEQML